MKQKWPILIFSALLTAFIVLAGIWGNAQFEHLHSGSMLTAEYAAQGIALDGWRQEAPGQWHFTFTVGEDIPSLTLCVTNTAVPLAHENLTSLERSGELYALDVTPGETVELVFTCSRSPQTWLMTSAFADRAFRFRTMTQVIALTAFVTMGMVLLALYPWVEIKSDSSPFVMIFHNLDSNVVASALNFVILVASLSVYNSGVYSNSRMLFGLSVQGNAPKFLARVSKRGVPVNSLLLSGVITSLVVVLNYLLPHEALGLLMALVVATLLLNWIMICMAHLKFRAAQRRKGRESKFKALLAPASNYFCIAFLGLILVLMCTIDGMRLSAILLPVWIIFLFAAFKLLRRPA